MCSNPTGVIKLKTSLNSFLEMINIMKKDAGNLTYWSHAGVVPGAEYSVLAIEPDLQLALDADEVMVGMFVIMSRNRSRKSLATACQNGELAIRFLQSEKEASK